MTVTMGILAFFTFFIGLFPQLSLSILTTAANILTATQIIIDAEPISILQQISIFTLGFISVIILLAALKFFFGGKVELHDTWGCGYDNPNNHMQYSASSYASPFLAMLRPLFKRIYDVEKPRKLFPNKAHFNTQVSDIEEVYVINPLVKFDEWFLAKFEKIQSGNIQSYIKYGLIFLVIIVVGCLIIG